jgi:pyruvate dehydrogenase E1 component
MMPTFRRFPTGSMGLGPLNAYRARFMRYLEHRSILQTDKRRVWAFVGDGEMDEPESLAGLSLTARRPRPSSSSTATCSASTAGGSSSIIPTKGLFAGFAGTC